MINKNSVKSFIRVKIPSYIQEIRGKKLNIIIGAVIIVPYIIFLSICHQSSSTEKMLQNKRSEVMLHELNDINTKLSVLEDNPANSKEQQMALKNIEKDISSIQKSIMDIAKTSDILKVSNQITSVKDDMDTQMSDLKKSVSESAGNKHYLDPSALPFHVISVDMIAGQSYITVNYANHISPLGMTDILAGWRLVVADYDTGVAEFVNDKNQYVKVSLYGG